MRGLLLVLLSQLLFLQCLGADEDEVRAALCEGKNAGEYFRLVPGDKHCRDVVACADDGLQALRCPTGLVFDISKQTCDWKAQVNNCDLKSKPLKALPQLKTEEPLCQEGHLACGDGACVRKTDFCDGVADCGDSSDENYCGQGEDPNGAFECDTSECYLPDCFCSVDSKAVPGDLKPETIPQMITLSFDDAVNNNNFEVYEKLFNGKFVNPNGCNIKATFFVSHQYTNYSMVEALHLAGQEIATHTMTHNDDKDYWTEGSEETWRSEFLDGREALKLFAFIPSEDVVGVRAPQLRVGGNRQFEAMQNGGFLYDSSMVAKLQNPPLWPYNVYYAMPHTCYGDSQKCPTRSYAIWEMVLNELDRREEPSESSDEVGCVTLDGCNTILTPSQLYNVLTHNFIRHYDQNRAPLNIYLHAAWFKNNPDMLDAFIYWMEEILGTYDDVYFLTYSQVLEWIQSPAKSDSLKTRNGNPLPGWKSVCQLPINEETNKPKTLSELPNCDKANNCKLTSSAPEHKGADQRLHTCRECPAVYPWLGNPKGDQVLEPGL